MLIRLAARNLLRHTRRTVITVVAIAVGLALMVWSNNLNYGFHQDMVQSGVSLLAGHVVVQAKGYQKDHDPKLLVGDASSVVNGMRKTFPSAKVVERTFLQGLVTSPRSSVAILINAVNPAAEAEVTDWEKKIVAGAWFDDPQRGIVLGVNLADALDVELGDKVVVMTEGEEDISSRLYRVNGLMKTGSQDMDGFLAIVPIQTTGELTGRADAVTQISIHDRAGDPEDMAALGRLELRSRDDVEVLTWEQALPELVQFIRLDDAGNHVFMGVIGMIVAMGVLNTVLMSVMERVREFGVMLALGVAPRQVSRIVLLEGAILGVVSMIAGVSLGLLATWPLLTHGLDYTKLIRENVDIQGVSVSMVIYPMIDVERTVVYAVVTIAVTVLAVLYPAFLASRLKPVDAMRYV